MAPLGAGLPIWAPGLCSGLGWAGLLIWAPGLCSGLGWAGLLIWFPGLCSGLGWAGCPCCGRTPGATLVSLSLAPACGCGAGPLFSRSGIDAGLLLFAGWCAEGWPPLVSLDSERGAAGG